MHGRNAKDVELLFNSTSFIIRFVTNGTMKCHQTHIIRLSPSEWFRPRCRRDAVPSVSEDG